MQTKKKRLGWKDQNAIHLSEFFCMLWVFDAQDSALEMFDYSPDGLQEAVLYLSANPEAAALRLIEYEAESQCRTEVISITQIVDLPFQDACLV